MASTAPVPVDPVELIGARMLPGNLCEVVHGEAALDLLEGKQPAWVHIVGHDVGVATEILRDRLGFHELSVEDALTDHERPQLHEYPEVLFFNVPTFHRQNLIEIYSEVGFFLKANALVTVSTRRIPLIEEWNRRWAANPKRVGGSAPMLCYTLVDAIVDQYFPLLDNLEDEVDDLADAIFRGETTQVRQIIRLKRRLLEFRRRISPVRDVMNSLLRRDVSLIPDRVRPYFQDIYEHTIRLSEMADISRDTLASVLDLHLSMVSNNLNQVVKKLTVLSTIFMSSALIAGIYGMNFKHMPELDWVYGYPFAIGLMALVSIGILFIFRRIKWL